MDASACMHRRGTKKAHPTQTTRDASLLSSPLEFDRFSTSSHANLSSPSMAENWARSSLSPFLITLIGIASTAFMLLIYHYVVAKWCNRRDQEALRAQQGPPFSSGEEMVSGLDSYSMQLIPALKYGKEVSIEGGECSVCLCEFKEGEEVRRLPECLHSYHVPCIDMWLSSHTSCPLCRTDMTPSPNPQQMVQQEYSGLPNLGG